MIRYLECQNTKHVLSVDTHLEDALSITINFEVIMKHYKPIGDDKQGYKLTIPASVQRYDLYRLEIELDGTLIYTPVRT